MLGALCQLVKKSVPHKLQSLILAQGMQVAPSGVLCGTLSGGCCFHQTYVGGSEEPEPIGGIRREDSSYY